MDADSLARCRSDIDRIDVALIALLAKRFKVVDRVVAVKLREGLPAAIPDRIEQVVKGVRDAAAVAGVPPDAVERVWRELIAQTIAYERGKRVR